MPLALPPDPVYTWPGRGPAWPAAKKKCGDVILGLVGKLGKSLGKKYTRSLSHAVARVSQLSSHALTATLNRA